jgi:hypothetical protein
MNLNEALKTLRTAGYKLIKEDAAGNRNFVCYSIYGDRAHTNPETAYIYAISQNKQDIINTITNWFEAGPDDIWFCGVIDVDDSTVESFKKFGKEDIADTPYIKELMPLIEKPLIEYSGDSGLELYDEDDEEGSLRRIREMVTNDIEAL